MNQLAWLSAIILDSALKATALLALAWAGAVALRNHSAAARHLARTFVLCALLLLPFSHLLPAWQVRGIPEFAPDATAAVASVANPSSLQTPAAAEPAHPWPAAFASDPPVPAPATAPQERRNPAVDRSRLRPSQATSFATDTWVVQTRSANPVSPALQKAPLAAMRLGALNFLAALWLLGAVSFTLRWTMGLLRLQRLVRRATPAGDPGWNAQAQAVARSLRVRRSIALLESAETDVPLAAGILHPAVIVPPDYAEWSEVRRNAVLHHEIAHIQRLDVLTQSIAQAVTSLYWFHPLAWLMARAIRAERERACDDQVLAAGTKASEYAHELLDIVSHCGGRSRRRLWRWRAGRNWKGGSWRC